MRDAKLVYGVLAGLFAGTLLGVLFAPAKGSETRRRLFGEEEADINYSSYSLEDYLPGNHQFRFVDESF